MSDDEGEITSSENTILWQEILQSLLMTSTTYIHGHIDNMIPDKDGQGK